MKSILVIGSFLMMLSLVQAQEPIQLFNQKDLSGWYAFEPETGKHDQADELFTVDCFMIRLYGPKAGYLMSTTSYQNFQLEVEYRWNIDTTFVRKNNSKNSGVMYLVPTLAIDQLWPQGIQFQIKEGATGDFILLKEVSLEVRGELIAPGASVVVKRDADAEKPIGEWNALRVVVKDGTVKQELNGVVVNEGLKPSVVEGRILLQYEGFPIDFRKVEITSIQYSKH